jgi:hypothetical protein
MRNSGFKKVHKAVGDKEPARFYLPVEVPQWKIVGCGSDLLADPLAAVHGKVEEAGVIAPRAVDAPGER